MLDTKALLRSARLLAALGLLASCSASGENLGEARPELGDFRLCYNIVTTNDTVRGPLSREANVDGFAEVLRNEIDRRFDRYQSDRLYHLAMHMDAYVLAVPGIPIIASPRSALILSVHVWDDALGRPLNEEHKQFTVLESVGENSVLGSGLTQSAEQQMQHLARNAALQIEDWLAENPDWFIHDPDPAADTDEAATPATAPASDPANAGQATCGHR